LSKEIALRSDALTATEVESVTFRVTRFRPGYDAKEVDDFLDRVQSEVALLAAENEKLRAALSERDATRVGDANVGEFGSGATVISGTAGFVGGGGAGTTVTGSADLLARRADIERDVNALEAFEREYRTRLRAWIGGMLDELDHPEDVPINTPPDSPKPLREKPLITEVEFEGEIDDTSEIPVIDQRWEFERRSPQLRATEKAQKKKKKKKEKKGKYSKSPDRVRDFTLPANDPHGPDPVTQPA